MAWTRLAGGNRGQRRNRLCFQLFHFISFRGQLTKCPTEHVRKASALESIAAGSWEAAIDDVLQAAKNDLVVTGGEQEDSQDE